MRSTLLILTSLIAVSLAVPTLPENLFFYTKLESVKASDETGRQANATTIGTPSSVTGYNGNGVRFNSGTNPTDALLFGPLAIAGPVTYTAWFKLDSLQASKGKIFSNKADYDTDSLGGEIEVDTNEGAINYIHGAKIVDGATVSYTLNTWYHVAFVGSASAPTVVYINGSRVTTSLGNGGNNGQAVANPGKSFSVGSSTNAANNAINTGGAFRGIVDEIRIYNTTLTDEQVLSVFMESFDDVATSDYYANSDGPYPSDTESDSPVDTNTNTPTFPSGLTAIPTSRSAGSTLVLSFFVLVSAFLFIC